jgi:hypothetical protein
VAEQVVQRKVQLAGDREQRAHCSLALSQLELRQEAGRDTEPSRELANGDAGPLALAPHVLAY